MNERSLWRRHHTSSAPAYALVTKADRVQAPHPPPPAPLLSQWPALWPATSGKANTFTNKNYYH
ncbi:hypothetical protein SAMN02745857_02091 [Andreprevotia lacus DSM 23236]|jgi:hypothetical protein|uniref:Uncharacterized protein n=1 Tax=Andreprevotia lacus DSM 23236 TaxID=1121001 RepID=A0A1W1XMS9_9NEIS|nr:hypothetical protein [Andreprevotia lacus]SMC25253.1 hypothetical protein SAMN02745857_02091 [Andreprevotia lacus DSM 23236]